ncbi:transcription antitermination factor NusB [Bombilactobacillus folatiphilus]|uniref:Transcription antitermination protein NusB n=1 Tax=Bombilactobacillus folatiphilus TaxID=2923362 RepID=A0ABY4P7E7_9LACO|nr:transcription antitermination factor NusB [Bombilactobacillus folatiphilus]UQS81628.1 transcription antitermination factor NusB [Bombilactobacillus folatiphilus]
MTLNRHNVRELAIQALFLLDSLPKQDVDAALQEVLALNSVTQTPDYLTFLVNGVRERLFQLDEQLTKHLKSGWSLARISRIDVNIMRLALFEVQNSPAVPAKVAINEALELTEQFSEPQSKKFINAVLSHFIEQVPSKHE